MFSYFSKKCPPVSSHDTQNPAHRKLTFTSNRLWFFLCLLQKNPHCLSWLCGDELPEMLWFIFLCSTAVLMAWGASIYHKLLRYKCCLAHWGFHILSFTAIQSVGTFYSYSSHLSEMSFFVEIPNSSANKKISFPISVPHLVALSPSRRLDWFNFVCYMAFCHNKINGFSQV